MAGVGPLVRTDMFKRVVHPSLCSGIETRHLQGGISLLALAKKSYVEASPISDPSLNTSIDYYLHFLTLLVMAMSTVKHFN